jgi:hypothetical protein
LCKNIADHHVLASHSEFLFVIRKGFVQASGRGGYSLKRRLAALPLDGVQRLAGGGTHLGGVICLDNLVKCRDGLFRAGSD